MRWNILRSLTSLCIAALVMTFVGCGTESPEEQVAKVRAQYTVSLESFTAEEVYPEPAATEETAEGAMVASSAETAVAAEAAAAEEGAAEEEMEPEEGPRTVEVLFDLVVLFRGRKSLNGITVDVTHADAADQEKAVYQQYIETADMENGETRQVEFVLEGLEFEEGDAFAVTLASGVPADLGNYREFSEPAP